MGHSISQETGRKLDENRRAGRLCAGGVRHCTKPATVKVHQTAYTHEWGVGKPAEGLDPMTMCTRHAREFPPGYQGVNFRVDSHERY